MGTTDSNWTWDPDKDRINRQKHRIRFQTAVLVFNDPNALMDEDPYPLEQRYRTIGYARQNLITVIHTYSERNGEPGRIISARRANRQERRSYEEEP